MNRSLKTSLVLLLAGGLTLVACKKKEETSATAQSASAPAATAPAETAPPAASESAPPAATTPPPPAPVAQPAPQRPIDDCCAALAAVRSSGRGREAKQKAATAARICPAIARQVREGRTQRSSALTQIKAQLAGTDVPAACN